MPQGSNAREEITGTLNSGAKGEKRFYFQPFSRGTQFVWPNAAMAGS
jgi:hypothetical protein